MIERLKKFLENLFTEEKFPDKMDRDAIGDKTVGDVYDMTYMPSPEEPGEMIVVFGKKEEDE